MMWKTILGGVLSIVWMLLLGGETDAKDIVREAMAWIGGCLVGGGVLSADEVFRTWLYKRPNE